MSNFGFAVFGFGFGVAAVAIPAAAAPMTQASNSAIVDFALTADS
jgi:hypothetical protein